MQSIARYALCISVRFVEWQMPSRYDVLDQRSPLITWNSRSTCGDGDVHDELSAFIWKYDCPCTRVAHSVFNPVRRHGTTGVPYRTTAVKTSTPNPIQ